MEIKISAEDARADMDADRVYLASDIKLDILIFDEKCERIVTECKGCAEERYPAEKGTVKVYYPDSEEDAFTVARKFHVSVARLCENNSITTETASSENSSVKLPRRVVIF